MIILNPHLFKLAKDCSFNSDYTGCGSARIGTVVTYKGTVLAKGWNSNKTHSDQARFNRVRYKNTGNQYLPDKIHSEIQALSKIKYLDIDFSRVEVYNYREFKNGEMAMSRPCPACMKMIKEMGIRTIHYTTPDGFATEKLAKK